MADTLDALIRSRIGQQRYGLFFATGEGRFFPNGAEDRSGIVVTEGGTHYYFWTEWSDGREVFGIWSFVPREPEWSDSNEYRRARAAAGLEG